MSALGAVVSNARRWATTGLLFISGFINYMDRAIIIAYLCGLLLLPIGFVANDVGAIMLIGAAGLVGMGTGNMFALLQRVASAGEVGLWAVVMNFGGNLSGIVAPMVTGLLIARTHYLLSGICCGGRSFALWLTVVRKADAHRPHRAGCVSNGLGLITYCNRVDVKCGVGLI
jgi:sugar phosphate permease